MTHSKVGLLKEISICCDTLKHHRSASIGAHLWRRYVLMCGMATWRPTGLAQAHQCGFSIGSV